MLLHRLQQRRLRARAGAVDLVGHQQLREDRSGEEAEIALAARRLFQHLGAENVGRHQVGRELDAARVEPERDAHGLDQLGLGEARHADQQRMAAGQHRDQRAIDHAFLAEDDRADRGPGGARMRGGGLRGTHHHVLEFFETFDRHLACSCYRFASAPLLVTHFGGPCRASCLRIMQASRHHGGASRALILLSAWSLRYFSALRDSRCAHHVRASALPDSGTVGFGQWPNHGQRSTRWLTLRQVGWTPSRVRQRARPEGPAAGAPVEPAVLRRPRHAHRRRRHLVLSQDADRPARAGEAVRLGAQARGGTSTFSSRRSRRSASRWTMRRSPRSR